MYLNLVLYLYLNGNGRQQYSWIKCIDMILNMARVLNDNQGSVLRTRHFKPVC